MALPQEQFPVVDEKTTVETPHTSATAYRQQLNYSIQIILSGKEESEFPTILRTINSHLRRYRLQDRFSPYEVFNEACDRAFKKFEKGEEIPNIPPWFRTTCFNIIREWSRETIRVDSVNCSYLRDDQDSEREQEIGICNPNQMTNLDLLAMYEVYAQLPEFDRKVLCLSVSGMSWEEIADYFIKSGEQLGDRIHVAQALAQRASRCRKRLRSLYFDS
jgi:DNA-directed RNA polymerase specialized sigma24 family protein